MNSTKLPTIYEMMEEADIEADRNETRYKNKQKRNNTNANNNTTNNAKRKGPKCGNCKKYGHIESNCRDAPCNICKLNKNVTRCCYECRKRCEKVLDSDNTKKGEYSYKEVPELFLEVFGTMTSFFPKSGCNKENDFVQESEDFVYTLKIYSKDFKTYFKYKETYYWIDPKDFSEKSILPTDRVIFDAFKKEITCNCGCSYKEYSVDCVTLKTVTALEILGFANGY